MCLISKGHQNTAPLLDFITVEKMAVVYAPVDIQTSHNGMLLPYYA